MQDFFHPQYVCTVDRTRGYISTIQRGEGFVPQCCSIHGLHHQVGYIQQYKLVKPPLAFIHKLLSPSDPNQLTFHLHFIWRSIWQIFWFSTHYLYIYILIDWLIVISISHLSGILSDIRYRTFRIICDIHSVVPYCAPNSLVTTHHVDLENAL